MALPFVEHHDEPAKKPAMSLDLLAEAFSHLGGTPEVVPGSEVAGSGVAGSGKDAPGNVESADAPVSADVLAATSAGTEPVESRSGARGRRGRRNRSASRAQAPPTRPTLSTTTFGPPQVAGPRTKRRRRLSRQRSQLQHRSRSSLGWVFRRRSCKQVLKTQVERRPRSACCAAFVVQRVIIAHWGHIQAVSRRGSRREGLPG